MSREIFLNAMTGKNAPRYIPACGSAVSMVTTELMDRCGCSFPEAHCDAELMAGLAMAGHTITGFDNVMPVFSTRHEMAALGAEVNWGKKNIMPDSKKALLGSLDELVAIPADFLKRPAAKVVLDALGLLKQRLGNDAAVLGKVFGPWTLGYDVYGVEDFLIGSLTEPDKVKRAMEKMLDVTLLFIRAQIEAGADAIALCDHCTRDLCSPETYRDFLLEIHTRIVAETPVPIVLHICGNTGDRIAYIRETKVAMFHYDSRTGIAKAIAEAGDMPLMGGTDNISIVRNGTPETVEIDIQEKLANKIAIIGPECAVPLDAPNRNLEQIASLVRAYRAEKK